MALKYNCPACSYEIITRYLKIGDALACPACKTEICVPHDAVQTAEDSNIIQKYNQIWGLSAESAAIAPEQPPTGPTMWGIKDILKAAVLYYGGMFILDIILILSIIGLLKLFEVNLGIDVAYWPNNYQNLHSIVLNILSMTTIILIAYHFVTRKYHNNFIEALFLDKINFKQFCIYASIGVACAVAAKAITLLEISAPIENDTSQLLTFFDQLRIFISVSAWRLLGALLAPIPEEIAFRGFMFTGLKPRFGQLWAAAIVCAAFVLFHGQRLINKPIIILTLALLGIVLMVVRIKTNSLTKTIAVHFFYNLMGFLFFAFQVLIFK
jgi:membrane protease YdiL (CAAX protease family)